MALATLGIFGMLKNVLSIMAYWFNPKVRQKRDRKADWKKMKELEGKYRKALANGDPMAAGLLHGELKALRAEYRYVGKS